MIEHTPFAWLYWDPPREAFTIPYFDIAVAWYGIIFASGFVAGYFILIPILRKIFAEAPQVYGRDIINWPLLAWQIKNHASESSLPFYSNLSKKARNDIDQLPLNREPSAELKQDIINSLNSVLLDKSLNISRKSLENIFPGSIEQSSVLASFFADKLTWFVVIGAVVGARLGHVLIYEWPYYRDNPLEILMIRKGGLASHGGTLAIMLALVLFLWWYRNRFPEISFVRLMDILVIPTALTVCFIRVANFFNQEILGNPTDLPWGVIFGHPADGTAPTPRHPVQLYEAAAYLATFGVLYVIWKKYGTTLKTGLLSGLFFIFVFGSRFLLEYLKEPQSSIDAAGLHMGQYLSIPFILLGIGLLFFPNKKVA